MAMAVPVTFSAGCAFNLRYIPGTPIEREPAVPIKVGVALFEDGTKGKYGPAGNTITAPIQTVSNGVANAVRELSLFSSCEYLDHPVETAGNLQEFRTRYGVDAILTGRASHMFVNQWPTPQLFLLFPLHLLSLVGVPTLSLGACFDGIFTCQIISCRSGRVLWNSGTQKVHYKKTIWVAPYDAWDAQQEVCILPVPLYGKRLRQRGFNQL